MTQVIIKNYTQINFKMLMKWNKLCCFNGQIYKLKCTNTIRL